jgi:hypothetical protein
MDDWPDSGREIRVEQDGPGKRNLGACSMSVGAASRHGRGTPSQIASRIAKIADQL